MAVKPEAHWRDSARAIRFFGLDGRASFPFVIFFMHISWLTFALALVSTIFFSILGRYGFSPRAFLRLIRSFIAGSRRYAQPWWEQ